MSIYVQDPLHSEIEFKIKHLMISNVRGRFSNFEVTMNSKSKDFSDAKIFCKVDMKSIYTGISERDSHLKSSDFFDVEKYPYATFLGKDIKEDSGKYIVYGCLTIKGVKNDIQLNVSYNGSDVDNVGTEKHGFDLETSINRKDWNLNFNIAGGKNTLLIGDEVKIFASIQMVQK